MKNKKILSNGRRKKMDVLGTSVQYSEYNTEKSYGWPNLLSKEKHLTLLDTTIAYKLSKFSNYLNKSCYKI